VLSSNPLESLNSFREGISLIPSMRVKSSGRSYESAQLSSESDMSHTRFRHVRLIVSDFCDAAGMTDHDIPNHSLYAIGRVPTRCLSISDHPPGTWSTHSKDLITDRTAPSRQLRCDRTDQLTQ
jgi:hypothetical protein